jgi:hypothetical protein
MATYIGNFNPNATKTIAASGTSAASSAFTPNTQFPDFYVYNATTAIAFVRFGVASPTAVITDFPIPPGAAIVLSPGGAVVYAAVILSASTGNVYVSQGRGS